MTFSKKIESGPEPNFFMDLAHVASQRISAHFRSGLNNNYYNVYRRQPILL